MSLSPFDEILIEAALKMKEGNPMIPTCPRLKIHVTKRHKTDSAYGAFVIVSFLSAGDGNRTIHRRNINVNTPDAVRREIKALLDQHHGVGIYCDVHYKVEKLITTLVSQYEFFLPT